MVKKFLIDRLLASRGHGADEFGTGRSLEAPHLQDLMLHGVIKAFHLQEKFLKVSRTGFRLRGKLKKH